MSRPGDLARIVRVSGTGKHVNGLERVGNGGNNEGILVGWNYLMMIGQNREILAINKVRTVNP